MPPSVAVHETLMMIAVAMLVVGIYGGTGGGVVPAAAAVQLTIRNRCNYTVWPGIQTGGSSPVTISGGATGFALAAGHGVALTIGTGWSGRVWGRTHCNFSASSGGGSCATGDCGGEIACGGGRGPTAPATLAEFALQSYNVPMDYYDVSLVDGFNLPMAVVPGNSSCKTAACAADYINRECPTDLRVPSDAANAAEVVACKSACLAFGSAQYCCTEMYDNPTTCTNTSYSRYFKAACPTAYTYAYDDASSLYTCPGTSYAITFCPGSVSSTLNDRGISLHNRSTPSSASSSSSSSNPASLPPPFSYTLRLLVLLCYLINLQLLILDSNYYHAR